MTFQTGGQIFKNIFPSFAQPLQLSLSLYCTFLPMIQRYDASSGVASDESSTQSVSGKTVSKNDCRFISVEHWLL